MNVNTRPIGYLLKLMNISYTELAAAIYVERTVVNKWALGKRSFHSGSKHYEEVVDYIIQVNNNKNILENFFENIYPNLPKGSTYTKDCINKFLSTYNIEPDVYSLIAEAKNSTVYCNIPIYNNTFGRFSALMQLLNDVKNSEKKQELVLYDNEQFEWISENENYTKNFFNQMIEVLQNGHHVTIILDVHYLESYYKFGLLICQLHLYKNLVEYFFISNKNPRIIYTCYLAKGKAIVMGNRMSNGELYTTVLRDPFSVSAAEEQVKNQLKSCTLYRMIQNDKERFKVFDIIRTLEKTNDLVYLYGSGLSYVTMSRELLSEVLKKNNVTGEKKEQILRLHDNHHALSFNKVSDEPKFRQMCYLENIQDNLLINDIHVNELSVLIGKRIIINKEMHIQHIKDTIRLLEFKGNFKIGLLRINDPYYGSKLSFLCRKNQYYLTCQNQLKITREVYIVNGVIELMDREWHHNLPLEYKDNMKVAQKLQQLLSMITKAE